MRIYKDILLTCVITFIILCEFPSPSTMVEAKARPTGTLNVLVLMVDFSDKPGQVQRSYFEDLIFGSKPSIAPLGSFVDYYSEISYGQIFITGQVNDGITTWYRMPQTYSYYVNNQYGFGTYPQNVQKLVEDAIDAAKASGIDFGPLDNDNDGYVDSLFIVHAGQGAEFTDCTCDIWSHYMPFDSALSIDTGSFNTLGNKVYVRDYTIEPEYFTTPNDMTIGVFAHEFGHVLGLPDLYDRDRNSNGLGNWSLMAGGSWNGPVNSEGSSPAHPDAWSKVKLGWVAPSMSSCPSISIPRVEEEPVIYKFVTNNPQEYFLVENRQSFGFDQYLPGYGLAIYHIDDSITTQNDMEWYPGCSTCTSHYLVALEQADGSWGLEKNIDSGDAGALFYKRGNKAFTSTSTPNSNDYANNQTSVKITNISASKAIMTAGIDIQKTSGIPIAVAPNDQMSPQVASDGTNSLVVYNEYNYTDDTYKIYGTFVGQSGGLVDQCRFYIADGSWPAIAFDGTNYLVVYAHAGDIYGKRVSSSGRVLDRKGFRISSDADWEFAPRVAFNGTVYLVVYHKQVFDPEWYNYRLDVWGVRVRPDGRVLDPQGIDIFPAVEPFPSVEPGECYPDAASDGFNFAVVAGDCGYDAGPWKVYGARINNNGVLLDTDSLVITTTGGREQSIAFDGTIYLVVWADHRNTPEFGDSNSDIYGSRVTSAGAVLDPGGIAISTASRDQFSPSIMVGQDYIVAWSDKRNDPLSEICATPYSDIYAARVTSFGSVLDPTGLPVSTAVNGGLSDIAFDGTNFFIVWEDVRNGGVLGKCYSNNNPDIYGARVGPDGTVLDP